MKYLKLFEQYQDYKTWKRKNVTYRGISSESTLDAPNGGSAILGEGLYTTPASNKQMAKGYGKLYFCVNARPKKPIIFGDLNRWEIWYQNTLLKPYNYDIREFRKHSTIKDEVMKLGYDGVEIKGREMVNYTPENVMYFSNEKELMNYFYQTLINI